ncbi:MAG: hypothetical protein V1887_03070 [Candidatus Aenigmatarchaeota archaeon]
MEQTKLLALTVLVVFLLSMIPAMASVAGNAPNPTKATITTKLQTFTEAKAGFVQAKQDYLQAKTNFIAYRLQFAERDRTAFLKGQAMIAKGIEQLLMYIDVLSGKVNETQGFDASKKADLTAELAGYRTTLQADLTTINSTSNVDDIHLALNQTRKDWMTIQPQLKRIAGEIIIARADAAVAKAEAAVIKLDSKIAELKASGNDTTKLERISAQVKIKIIAAKEKMALAKDRLSGVKSSGNAQGLLTAADQFVKQANRWMQEMQYLLGQAVREINRIETGHEGPEHTNATLMSSTPMGFDDNQTEESG